jgi:hypothetical protein
VELPAPPPGDAELGRAHYQATLDDVLGAHAFKRSEEAAEPERNWQRVKVTLDSEQALRQSVHQARVEVAKDTVSRCREAVAFGRDRGCPDRRGTLVTAVPLSWLHSEGGCEFLVGSDAAAGEVVFDRDGEVGEAAVALDFAESGLGFEHPGGGPP